MRVFKFLLSVLLLSGCSTVKLNELDYSLLDIQKGITKTAPKGILKVSANQRTFTSRYFDPDSFEASRETEKGGRERATVEAIILGDRRPYDVEIVVLIEEDSNDAAVTKDDDFIEGHWIRVGTDKGLAKYFRDRLANYLVRVERNKNLIDDFRPF